MLQIFNIPALILASLVALTAAPVLAGSGHDLKPQFGGVVVETKAGEIEIVAKSESIQIHITDHGKAVKLEGAKAKVTLLNGSEKSETELVTVGDKLEAKGTFKAAKGTKGIAVVTLAGKAPITARFEVK